MRAKGNAQRGETLVETVVSFSVLLIMLAMLATVMRSAARISNYAAERAAILEEDCTRVEQNMGVYSEGSAQSDTLTLTSIDPLDPQINIDIDVRSAEILHYFRTVNPGGGQ